MSESNGKERKSAPVFSRKIGVGLSRINLSPGLRETSQRGLGREPALSMPSKVTISGNSLGGSRLTADRYTSGYSRLGGYKNTSSPNVSYSSTAKLSVDKESSRNDLDINQNSQGQLRKNFSATNTSELLKDGSVTSSVDVQRSQSAKREYNTYNLSAGKANTLGPSSVLLETMQAKTVDFNRNNSDNIKAGGTQESAGKNNSDFSCSYKRVDKSSVRNYDIDLEQDEEDACVTPVKDIYVGSQPMLADVTSPQSPSKDSGYHSPKMETDVDSFSTSISKSRSPEATETVTNGSEKIVSEKMPERPVRTKSASRKRVTEQFKQWNQLDSSPRRPGGSSPMVSGVNSLSPGKSEGDLFQNTVKCGDLYNDLKTVGSEKFSTKSHDSLVSNETSKPLEGNGDENVPVARPRSHRRLTKRCISFKKLEDDEYIGFASLPEQVHRKAVRRGFEFTLMVVGETGLGKSTLINSLFLMDLYKDRKVTNIEERVQKTVGLEKKELEIEERGVKLKLTIVDTPGFNDAVNAEESWKPIVNYIDSQFNGYFTAESGLNRKNIQDTRVHCCLYFISPYGHGLRPADVMVMKKLHHKVNIIPLIAKSDMLTKQEVKRLKEKVLEEIKKHNIHIYQYPDCDSDEDEEFKQQDVELKKSIPFAVVGSNTVVEAGGKKIRGRMYPWGIVEVENPLHSDFIKLRQMLISTHMQDLKDVTCDVHYENYRAEHISEQMTTGQRERGKLKRDSVANLEQSLDTEKLLQEKEAEIKRMQEMLAKMQAQLNGNSPRLNGKVGHV